MNNSAFLAMILAGINHQATHITDGVPPGYKDDIDTELKILHCSESNAFQSGVVVEVFGKRYHIAVWGLTDFQTEREKRMATSEGYEE